MSHPSDCVFCRIVAGTLPCFRVFEDAETLAFMDINPFNPGHALAIPKAHFANAYEIPADLAGATMATATRVARAVRAVLQPDGINLVQANDIGAGQTVFHFHVHIFPRRLGDAASLNWDQVPGDMASIKALAEKVAAAI
ncbi:MAG: HIT family protein [Pseudomonadota bacterium]|nr:HIT family protein [Pseudomonadota bacterium]